MLWALTGAQWLTVGWTVLTLVILEGLLSADNALVLAMMVRPLPPDQRRRALRYGIWGALVFRLIAVAFASVLLDFWVVEVAGGLYLAYLAARHFLHPEPEAAPGAAAVRARSFWGTVVAVELTDIAFSVDSILAAVGLADGMPTSIQAERLLGVSAKLWIIYVGGVLGIITMRYVATLFIRLLDRFPGLKEAAYGLVAWIGLKLIGSGTHHALHPAPGTEEASWLATLPGWVRTIPTEMSPPIFWTGMGIILVLGLMRRPRPPSPGSGPGPGAGPEPGEEAAMMVSEALGDRP